MELHKEKSRYQEKRRGQEAPGFRRYRPKSILDAYRGRCSFCGAPVESDERFRHENFKQGTKDHSERERLNDSNVPSHLMYNCLGISDAFIDVAPTRVIENDRYVI